MFVRSLVGLDREAAKGALAGFLAGKAATANQIEFLNLIVNHLTEHGVMEPALLYESPFTDLTPRGPEGLFDATQVGQLVAALERITAMAYGTSWLSCRKRTPQTMSNMVVGRNMRPAIRPQRIDCGLRKTDHIDVPALLSQL